jgi:hypothetical protein
LPVAGRISAGASFIGRSLDIVTAGEDQASYDGIYAPGVHLDGELIVRGKIGFELFYDHSVGLKSGLAGAAGTPLPSAQSRMCGAVFYRRGFARDRVAIHLGAGAGRVAFAIDDTASAMPVLVPDVSYTYVAPTVALRLVASDRVGLSARASGLAVIDSGEVSASDRYGDASVIGYDLLASADIAVSGGLGLRAGLTLTRLNLDFDGSGAMQADGGSDRYAGGHVGATYAF